MSFKEIHLDPSNKEGFMNFLKENFGSSKDDEEELKKTREFELELVKASPEYAIAKITCEAEVRMAELRREIHEDHITLAQIDKEKSSINTAVTSSTEVISTLLKNEPLMKMFIEVVKEIDFDQLLAKAIETSSNKDLSDKIDLLGMAIQKGQDKTWKFVVEILQSLNQSQDNQVTMWEKVLAYMDKTNKQPTPKDTGTPENGAQASRA